jgi:two-component system, NtrC family, response regulator AtoC
MVRSVAKILTIEDEENLRFSIVRSLSRAGHHVAEAASAADAWNLTRDTEFDLILTDVNLDGDNGVDLVKRLRADGYEGVIIVLTAYGTVENAVEAMKLGANDYLQKPISLEELQLIVTRALEQRRIRSRLALYERMEQHRSDSRRMIGESQAWLDTLNIAERFAEIPVAAAGDTAARQLTTILLLGETGVGKGLLAKHIHDHHEQLQSSERPGKSKAEASTPFVHVNCSALPPALVESELFGHERGAFTDAKTARAGLFELAEGGTIFLDEIGEMSLELQAKLLLVLEEGAFRRVGGSKVRHVRARVIAATNQELAQQIETGRFRRDLYYRLSAFTITIPTLRERDNDLVLLAESLLERVSQEFARPGLCFDKAALTALQSHYWPGNVRELINVIQRAVMLCADKTITTADLGLESIQSPSPSTPKLPTNGAVQSGLIFDFQSGGHTLETVEQELIRQALVQAQGNISKAARLAGMNRSSFRYRIERSGLESFAEELAK